MKHRISIFFATLIVALGAGMGGLGAQTSDLFNLTDTWNDAGTDFDSIKMVVTDTASGAGSDILDLSIASGASFRIPKNGSVVSNGLYTSTVADGATAKGFTFTTPSYTTSGAKLVSFFNNAAEKVYIDKDGGAVFTADSARKRLTITNDGNDPVIHNDATSGFHLYIKNTRSQGTLWLDANNIPGAPYAIPPMKYGVNSAESLAMGSRADTGAYILNTSYNGDFYVQNLGRPTQDEAKNNLRIVGAAAAAAATTNLDGGGVFVTAGAGASGSAGDADGGAVTITGGGGYGTGDGGNIVLSGGAAAGSGVEGEITLSSVMRVEQSYAVAALPTCTVGRVTRVTDASAPSIGSTVAGGGAAAALVWCNGSNWTVIGI